MLSILVAAGWSFLGIERDCPNQLYYLAVTLLISALFPFLLVARLGLFSAKLEPQTISLVEGIGTLHAVRVWGENKVALVDTDKNERFAIQLPPKSTARDGSVVSFRAKTREFLKPHHPRDFNEEIYWRSKGARAFLNAWSVKTIAQKKGIYTIRDGMLHRAQKLPPRVRAYFLASFLGIRDPDLQEIHRKAGTVHLLAISGFHVGVVFAASWFLMKKLSGRLIWVSGVLWLYVLLAGAPASAVRAALMLQIVLLGRILGRPSSPLNSVLCAAVMMLSWNPWLYWDVGWRLSVVAVVTLICSSGFCQNKFSNAFLSSLLIWWVTAPIISWNFDAVPFVGILLNVVALPFFAIALPFSFLFAMPVLYGAPGGELFAQIPEKIFFLWEHFSDFWVTLLPWDIGYSFALALSSLLILGFLIANKTGISAKRSAIGTLFLTALWVSAV